MPVSAADLPELSRLLDEALAIEPDGLEAWYAAMPGGSRHLLPALRSMVTEARRAQTSGLLSSLPQLEQDEPVAREGEIVGPYRLIRPLGQGGMGAVWLAERADGTFKRQVALKLPRLAWAAGLARRMAREREIGAMLEHPNIARLYDAGVDDKDRPYLALEYIEGVAIDRWCKDRNLSVRDKLRLIVQVARAVAYAHGRLIVHRDLKPSNVLVSADGQVHLLDFGIARLLDDAGEQATQEHTRAMTPQYASPEQIRGEAITVQTDVYGLGLMVYELLTGAVPHSPRRKSLGAIEEAILEGDVPIASSRVTDRALQQQLRGDVDAILGKAMKVEPGQRYATADAFAMDIERHLGGKTVTARADSAAYRIAKMLKRHWVGLSATTAVLVAVLAGVGATVAQAQRAAQAAERAKQIHEFVSDIFQVSVKEPVEPGELRSAPAQAFLARSAQVIKARFDGKPEIQAELYAVVGKAFQDMGANRLAREYAVQRVQALEASRAGRPEAARAYLALARVERKLDEKYAAARRAIELASGDESIVLDAQLILAGVLHQRGRIEQATQLLDEVDQRLSKRADGGGVLAARSKRVRAHGMYRRNRHDEARRLWDEAIAAAIAAEGPDSETAADTRIDVAWQLASTKDIESTDRYFDAYLHTMRRLGAGHRISAAFWVGMLGRYRAIMGNLPFDRALADIEGARKEIAADGRPVPADMAMDFDFFEGSVLLAWGKVAAATPLLERSVPGRIADEDSPARRFHYAFTYAESLMSAGRHVEAERWLAEAIGAKIASSQDRNPWMAGMYLMVARNLKMSGRHGTALAYLASAPQFPQLTMQEDLQLDRYNLLLKLEASEILLERGDLEAANERLPRALLAPPDQAMNSLDDRAARFVLGRIRCAGPEPLQGLSELEEVLRRMTPKTWDHDPSLAYARAIAGLCAAKAGKVSRARSLADQARTSFGEQPSVSEYFKFPLRELEVQLAGHGTPR